MKKDESKFWMPKPGQKLNIKVVRSPNHITDLVSGKIYFPMFKVPGFVYAEEEVRPDLGQTPFRIMISKKSIITLRNGVPIEKIDEIE